MKIENGSGGVLDGMWGVLLRITKWGGLVDRSFYYKYTTDALSIYNDVFIRYFMFMFNLAMKYSVSRKYGYKNPVELPVKIDRISCYIEAM